MISGIGRVACALLLGLGLAACEQRPAAPPEAKLVLSQVGFPDLPGWREDDAAQALAAFQRSCGPIRRRNAGDALGRNPVMGKVGDWRAACAAADAVPPGTARAFFEAQFTPWKVTDGGDPQGLFTGYYEPRLMGSRTPAAGFPYPLYKRPPDLVTVALGQFDQSLEGKRIAGRVEGGSLKPYPDRAEIDRGALDGRQLELLWVTSDIDRFFLQIQGSGQVVLPDGAIVRVGYAEQNGRTYRAVGRDLIERGEISQAQMSMQAIRDWLNRHPEQASELMQRNPSYVFFRELSLPPGAPGPLGAQGVPLTPGRSLAVDPRFVGYGTPLWLDTTVPTTEGDRPLRRLVVAQDTGGAIRGVVRGDVFWGAGAPAEHMAGHMKSRGQYWILLPKALVPSS